MIIGTDKLPYLYCQDTMTKLDIVLFDEDHIGISHCCQHMNQLTDIISITDAYNMTHDEFIDYLIKAYKHVPGKHNNFRPKPHLCKTNKKCCIYGKKTLKAIGVCISRNCNLSCSMCFDKFKRDALMIKYKQLYFHLLNKLKGIPDIGIRLTGIGEPFFYKTETFDYLQNLTINDCHHIEAISNITLLDKNDIEKLYHINKTIPIVNPISIIAAPFLFFILFLVKVFMN